MFTLTDDQVKAIHETKEKIKGLVMLQKKEKSILRKPHINAIYKSDRDSRWDEKGIAAASTLMSRTRLRAKEITDLLIEYNKMRGKPYDMYVRKDR
jgi:hypothetical protein